ncbi:MAG: hypothetical protein BA861_02800 [Desulfobacterales bacterium S3730MH5]|nr:MAG: hypothetical protein BA861_02800 [Desulfobacterales bacterium S3730MH5]
MPDQIMAGHKPRCSDFGLQVRKIRREDPLRKIRKLAKGFTPHTSFGTLICNAVDQKPNNVVLIFSDKANYSSQGEAPALVGIKQKQGAEVFLYDERHV